MGLQKDVINLIKEKRKARKLFQKTGNKEYKILQNKLNRELQAHIKEENKKKWEEKCNQLDLQNGQFKTWKNIRKTLGLSNKGVEIPTLVQKDSNGKVKKYKTPKEKLEVITESLESVFTQDNPRNYFNEDYKKEVEYELQSKYKQGIEPTKIPKRLDIRISEYYISEKEIESIIDNLNTKKAAGDDRISNKIIQYLKPSLLPILHYYFNISLHKGYHTINWKQIMAILLNKPGKIKSNPINYRTISLINNLSKIMEKLLTIRITK